MINQTKVKTTTKIQIKKTTYKTLQINNHKYQYEDKKSKFIAHTYKINNKEQIKQIIKQLKIEHPKSNHTPYAFRLGIQNIEIGFSDDGEPTGSAGKPIYFEIKGKELQNILICVVRYFGGIKLGVGGLTKAFSTAAKTVIEEKENKIIEKQICDTYKINFSYSNLKELEIFCIQNKFEIIEKNFDENCKYQIEIPILKSKIIEDFLKLNEIKFQK